MTDIDYLLEGDPREKIRWRRKDDVFGDPIYGSRAMVAQLELTDRLAIERFGPHSGFEVFQCAFNTDVEQSAGTHDFDKCVDGFVAGRVPIDVQRRFLRGPCMWWGWFRVPPTFSLHFHGIASHGYDTPVGELVPGQIADYLAKPPRNGLAGHALDPTWHPDPIPRFNYEQWKDKQMVDLSPAAVSQVADKAVQQLLGHKLTLSDGTEVPVSQALRRAAQMPDNLAAVRDSLQALIRASAGSTNQKVVNARNAVMAKLDEIDSQVGPVVDP
jgi:hypothetical protein